MVQLEKAHARGGSFSSWLKKLAAHPAIQEHLSSASSAAKKGITDFARRKAVPILGKLFSHIDNNEAFRFLSSKPLPNNISEGASNVLKHVMTRARPFSQDMRKKFGAIASAPSVSRFLKAIHLTDASGGISDDKGNRYSVGEALRGLQKEGEDLSFSPHKTKDPDSTGLPFNKPLHATIVGGPRTPEEFEQLSPLQKSVHQEVVRYADSINGHPTPVSPFGGNLVSHTRWSHGGPPPVVVITQEGYKNQTRGAGFFDWISDNVFHPIAEGVKGVASAVADVGKSAIQAASNPEVLAHVLPMAMAAAGLPQRPILPGQVLKKTSATNAALQSKRGKTFDETDPEAPVPPPPGEQDQD